MSNIIKLHPDTPLTRSEWYKEQKRLSDQMDWNCKAELDKWMRSPITIENQLDSVIENVGPEIAARIGAFNAEWYLKKDTYPVTYDLHYSHLLQNIGLILIEQLKSEMMESVEERLYK